MRRPPTLLSPIFFALFAPVLVTVASGCAPESYPEPSAPSAPSGSMYSASVGSSIGSSSFGGESFSAPQRDRASVMGDLVVRPDMITIVFAVKDTQPDPDKA